MISLVSFFLVHTACTYSTPENKTRPCGRYWYGGPVEYACVFIICAGRSLGRLLSALLQVRSCKREKGVSFIRGCECEPDRAVGEFECSLIAP